MSRTDLSEYIGREFETNKSGKCFVVDCKNVKSVIVMFYDGYTTTTQMSNLKRGSVRNPYHENNKLYGVGITDIAGCINGKRDYLYRVWESMITRCYSEKYQQQYPTYREVSVCERWQTYSLFKEDLEKMKCFDKLGVGYHLDKDLIKQGNKLYSPYFCAIVPEVMNLSVVKPRKLSNNLPTGVHFCKRERKYVAQVHRGNGQEGLGYFETPELAHTAYIKAKRRYLSHLSTEYRGIVDDKVCDALLVRVV